MSNGTGSKLAQTIGKDKVLLTNKTKRSAEDNFTFSGPSDFIPGQFNSGKQTILDVAEQVKKSGFYRLNLNKELQEIYAYNYNNIESSLDYYSASDLKNIFGSRATIYDETASANFTQLINEKESGISLWRLFLIGALLFLLIEQLLIRFMKN